MRVNELLPLILGDADEIVDVSPEPADLRQLLRVPERIRYNRSAFDEAASLNLGPGTLVVGLFGPTPPAQSDPDALGPVLRTMQPGARALLLIGWPIPDLPANRLLGPLVEGNCQIVDVVPLDRAHVLGAHCALMVECVDKLAPTRLYLIDIPRQPASDARAGTEPTGELRTMLRAVNEYVLGDFVSRPLRQRLQVLEAVEAERLGQIKELKHSLARTEARLASIEQSTTYQVGRALVDGIRHPARAVVSVPRDLTRVWRNRKAQPAANAASGSAPSTTRQDPPPASSPPASSPPTPTPAPPTPSPRVATATGPDAGTGEDVPSSAGGPVGTTAA